MRRRTILIVDDVESNRDVLEGIFCDDYDILQAEDGYEALELVNENHEKIAAILLDIIMPGMDGIEVLRHLTRNGRLTHIPVFIITAEDGNEKLLNAYHLGAVDVIQKPFISEFVYFRINSVVELYRHRNDLEEVVNEQIEKLDRVNRSMVETLATLIEFRDCESGEHVRRICGLTEILMTAVSSMYPEYSVSKAEIDKIVSASILHDVGKIAIPDSILNKPGRLTKEEFEIMKTHTTRGCDILTQIPNVMEEGIFKYGYDICRHHHERWDGRGYPDGLKGDDISIWAQVVSVADVYDALTSPRVYKAAFSVEKAVQMINDGECGIFNPKVLDAFNSSLDIIKAQGNTEFAAEA